MSDFIDKAKDVVGDVVDKTKDLTTEHGDKVTDAVDAEAARDFNRGVIEEFRANQGRVGGAFEGAPMMLLTTTGSKSGKARTTPVVYTRDGERYVIIASKAGAPTHPDWYHNLVSNPEVVVEVGEDTFSARAVVTAGEERARLYEAQAALMPNFSDYARNTTREIPVVALERLS